jgi:hypothetical protein
MENGVLGVIFMLKWVFWINSFEKWCFEGDFDIKIVFLLKIHLKIRQKSAKILKFPQIPSNSLKKSSFFPPNSLKNLSKFAQISPKFAQISPNFPQIY